MHSGKLKSSAIVVSFFVGAILSIILAASLLETEKNVAYLNERSNYELAAVVAKNGIAGGLKKYKGERADHINLFAATNRYFTEINGKKAYYDLSVAVAPLSIGENLSATDWLKDSILARQQKAFEVNSSKEFKINLVSHFNADITDRPQAIKIYSSDAFRVGDGKVDRLSDSEKIEFSYDLVVDGRKAKSGAASTTKDHVLSVDGLENCQKGVDCELIINFEIPSSHRAYLKIKAENAKLDFSSTSDEPGTIYIKSVGSVGGEQAKFIYKISSSGEYLGLSEEGVYCDSKCKLY